MDPALPTALVPRRSRRPRRPGERAALRFGSRAIAAGEIAFALAHRIDQPLDASTHLLRGLRSQVSREDEARVLDRAIEQLGHAARVIERLREFARHSAMPHALVDLGALVRASARLLDPQLRRSGVRLALETPVARLMVHGEASKLQQVLVTLMRNALDALLADPPPTPRLELRLDRHGAELRVEICDNGAALSDECEARLFLPHALASPSGRSTGLSLCRSCVEMHHGRLWVSRNEHRGVTVHLGLPVVDEVRTG
jgi:C4-dicarboxylate-specific signal transduction histidine kinase